MLELANRTHPDGGQLMSGSVALELPGNAPLRIDTAAAALLVVAGTVDVFAVRLVGGEPIGVRRHLCSVPKGEMLFGADLGRAETPLGMVAVGFRDARVISLGALLGDGRLRAPELAGELAGKLDRWVTRLSAGIAHGAAPNVYQELVAGDIRLAEAGVAARTAGAVVWIETLQGSCRLLNEVGAPAAPRRLPICDHSWLVASGECILRVVETRHLLGTDRDVAALLGDVGAFHRAALQCVSMRLVQQEADDGARAAARAALDEATMHDAGLRLASVLGPVAGRLATADSRTDPLLAACRLVGAAQGIEMRPHPAAAAHLSQRDRVRKICEASRIRSRQVVLRERWWRRDNGPLLGFRHGAGEDAEKIPVALLPTAPDRYDLVDPAAGTRRPLSPPEAENLSGVAHMFYRPLPDRVSQAWELLRFGLQGRRRDLAMVAAMGLAGGLLSALLPIVTGQIFGNVIPAADHASLAQMIAALMVSALAAGIFQITSSVAVLRLEGRMDGTAQAAVWDRLLRLPVAFFRRFTVGDLASRSLGVDAIRELFTGNVMVSILGAVFSLFSFALLFYYSWRLALLATGLVALLLTVVSALVVLQLRHQRGLFQVQGKLLSLLFELINGIGKLRVAGAEQRAYARWAASFAEQRQATVEAQRFANLQVAFNSTFAPLASLAIFAMIGLSTSLSLPVGEFLAFNAAFGQFLVAAFGLIAVISSLLTMVPIWERLLPLLAEPPEVDGGKTDPGALTGGIELSHVSFRYSEDGPLVLDDVSLRAGPGEFIALVGPSGSGKSTSLRLILGFEQPTAGSIYFDGQDLEDLSVQDVRRQIGVVLQSGRPMVGDLFTNIVGNSSTLTLADAWEAARMAGLDADIEGMPMGMHTVVAEGAETFSGGQKQRLLIARAIVGRPRMILFDEATSALDNRTQEIVRMSLERLKATRIVVAHRLSTITKADRIYVIQAGRVVESGSYDELAAHGEVFGELVRRQMA